jgi:hypothetical protein
MLEHRLHKRFDAGINVFLIPSYGGNIPGLLRNFSKGGMLIEVEAPIKNNAFVDIELNSDNGGDNNHTRIHGMVIHKSRKDLGIVTDVIDSETFAKLKGLAGKAN